MKIESGSPASVRYPSARAGDTRAAGNFASHLGTAAPRQAAGAVPPGPLGALLALQEIADPLQGRRRARERAARLLDTLDEIRIGLLTGTLSRPVLGELARLVGEARDAVDDPGLASILDEIDLRAQVELAKLEAHS